MRARDADVARYIREFIAQVLDLQPGEIDDTAPLASYGMNSVDVIDLVVKLEAEYGVQFDIESLGTLTCQTISASLAQAMDRKIDGARSVRTCAAPLQ